MTTIDLRLSITGPEPASIVRGLIDLDWFPARPAKLVIDGQVTIAATDAIAGLGSMRSRLAELERDVPGGGNSPWQCPRCGSHNVTARPAALSVRRRWEVRCLRCGLSAAFYDDDPKGW